MITTRDASFACRSIGYEEPLINELQVNMWYPDFDHDTTIYHQHRMSTSIGARSTLCLPYDFSQHERSEQSVDYAPATFQLCGLIYKDEPFLSKNIEQWNSQNRGPKKS